MALILNIESTTTVCSVALARNGVIVDFEESNDEGFTHAEKLAPYVQLLLSRNEISLNAVDAIAVSKGPGSYTGLRIGVSLAKGLCYGANKPLISVPTLQQMCLHPLVQKELNFLKDPLLCPMLDARRMEVFAAVYDIGLMEVMETQPVILDETSFSEQLSQDGVLFFGTGSEKFKEVVQSKSAYFLDDVWPSAKQMIMLSQLAYEEQRFEDLAYFEPFYLKDFQATTPKNKVV